jgi:glucan biosynthesis protein C
MNQKERAYYLDWIRIFVILLLVPFHSAITFATRGDGFIRYPQHVPVMDVFLWFLSIWIMPVLFMVSGISSYYALQHKTTRQYAKERRTKLLIPLLAGLLLVCPPMSYLRALFMGTFQGSLFQFYPQFFIKGTYPRGNLNWGHLWFLAYLYVFSMILLPLFTRLIKEPLKTRLKEASVILEKGIGVYLLAIPLMFSETLLRPHFPGLQNLVWDWANFILYLSLVFYGYLFAANDRILDTIRNIRTFSLFLGVVLFLAALASRLSGIAAYMVSIYPAYNALMVFAWIFTVLGYFKSLLNVKNRLYAYLNDASFPVYIFHFLPITVVAYFIARSDLNVWLKWFMMIVVAYPSAFILYEIVRRIPFARFIFGVKPR